MLHKLLRNHWFLLLAICSLFIVVVTRIIFPAFIRSDGPTIFEAGLRWSMGQGLTSSLFIEHPLNLADEPIYPTLTWWAPGAPLTLGLLLKLGFGQELSYRIYMLGTVLIGWAGWLAIARKYLSEFLSKNIFAGLIFSLLPLHFTPMRDPDEMAGWALLPWALFFIPQILSQSWLRAALLAGLLCALSVFYRYSAVQHVAVAVFTVLWFPTPWKRKLISSLLILLPTVFVWIGMRYTLGQQATYLQHEEVSLNEYLKLAFDAIGQTGVMPLLAIFSAIVPRDLFLQIEAFSDAQTHLGWLTFAIWAAFGVGVITIYLRSQSKHPIVMAVFLFLAVLLLSLPVFLLLPTVKTHNSYYFVKNVNYYTLVSPSWFYLFFTLLSIFKNKSMFVKVISGIFVSYLLYFSATPLFSKKSTARFNIIGYHYNARKFSKERISFLASSHLDLRLELMDGQPPGIFYAGDPDKFSPIHQHRSLSFRGLPSREEWKQIYASKPVTIYVVVREGEEPQPPKILSATKDLKNKDNTIPELKNLPGWRKLEGHILQSGKRLFVYRADIPAGWRGESLFNQEELSREEEAPSEQFTDAVVQ